MLIEQIDTFPLLHVLQKPYGDANGYKQYRTCFLFRVTTSTGISGWGEVVDWLPTLTVGFNERIIPYLMGKDATQMATLVSHIDKWHARSAVGVHMALTEIVAHSCQLSIPQLWGGAYHTQIPAYASCQSYRPEENWMQESLRVVERAAADGFRHCKIKIGGRSMEEDITHVTMVQDALEGRVSLALDANQSYDLSTALRWEPLLQQREPIWWLEEPLSLDQPREYAILRSMLSIPIAGGENLKGGKKFLPFLQEGALDIIQPDVMHAKGLDDYRHILQLARNHNLRVSPHCYDGILSRLYTLFAQACLAPWAKMNQDTIEPIEWDVMENPFAHLLPLKPSNGFLSVPTGVGIGLELDVEKLEAYRWNGLPYS